MVNRDWHRDDYMVDGKINSSVSKNYAVDKINVIQNQYASVLGGLLQ